MTEEFLQQRLYPNKSLTRLRFALPQGPEKRKPSPDRCSPDILIRTPSCDRRKSSMPRFVDVSNIATGNSVFTGFFIYVFHFVSLLVQKVKAIFSFATIF